MAIWREKNMTDGLPRLLSDNFTKPVQGAVVYFPSAPIDITFTPSGRV